MRWNEVEMIHGKGMIHLVWQLKSDLRDLNSYSCLLWSPDKNVLRNDFTSETLKNLP